jgi:hypothetical protein
MKINYLLTYHAIERLQERFGAFCARYPELKEWQRGDDISGVRLIIDDLIERAEENKSTKNNTRYMVYVYERYGYDCTYRFFEVKEENMVMLFSLSPNASYSLITIYPDDFCHVTKVTKFTNTDCKRVKEEKSLDQYLDTLRPIARECIESKVKDEQYYQLLAAVREGRATFKKRIGTSNVYSLVDGESHITFLLSNECGDQILTIKSIKDAAVLCQEQKRCEFDSDPELQKLVDPQLMWALISSIDLGETEIVDHRNEKAIHRTTIKDVEYEFVYRKNHKKSKVVLLKAKTITKD